MLPQKNVKHVLPEKTVSIALLIKLNVLRLKLDTRFKPMEQLLLVLVLITLVVLPEMVLPPLVPLLAYQKIVKIVWLMKNNALSAKPVSNLLLMLVLLLLQEINILPVSLQMVSVLKLALLVMLLLNLELDPPQSPLLPPSTQQLELNVDAKMDTENPLPPNKIKLIKEFALLVETKLRPVMPPRL